MEKNQFENHNDIKLIQNELQSFREKFQIGSSRLLQLPTETFLDITKLDLMIVSLPIFLFSNFNYRCSIPRASNKHKPTNLTCRNIGKVMDSRMNLWPVNIIIHLLINPTLVGIFTLFRFKYRASEVSDILTKQASCKL